MKNIIKKIFTIHVYSLLLLFHFCQIAAAQDPMKENFFWSEPTQVINLVKKVPYYKKSVNSLDNTIGKSILNSIIIKTRNIYDEIIDVHELPEMIIIEDLKAVIEYIIKTCENFQNISIDPDSILFPNSWLVFSASGAFFFPCMIGVGGGYERIYIMNKGLYHYLQFGIGIGSPGGAFSIETGPIWNVNKAEDYTGKFIEFQGSLTPLSGSIFFWNTVVGAKAGGSFGTPGGGVLFEYYSLF